MAQKAVAEQIDPRIRRTRQLLQDALCKLLKQKSFDEISVQDIVEEATVNRATFYDHYGDKFRLLDCLVDSRFHELLAERKLQFDSACTSVLQAFALAVCDYLDALLGPSADRRVEPQMESAIIRVLQSVFLSGLDECPRGGAPQEMVAAAAAWATYGAAKEWAQKAGRPESKEIAGTIAGLVAPILLVPRLPGEATEKTDGYRGPGALPEPEMPQCAYELLGDRDGVNLR